MMIKIVVTALLVLFLVSAVQYLKLNPQLLETAASECKAAPDLCE